MAIVLSKDVENKISSWSSKLYPLIAEELEQVVEALTPFINSRLAFEKNRMMLTKVMVSGLPSDIQTLYDRVDVWRGKHSVPSDILKARKEWNQTYRHRLNRMIDILGGKLFNFFIIDIPK